MDSTTPNTLVDGTKRHPIQIASRRSGLSKDVLRAWERRYRVVEPARTESGRRLYSDTDVERLRLLKQVTDAGRTIGQVAALSSDALASLTREDEAQSPKHGSGLTASRGPCETHLTESRRAVIGMDTARLKATIRRAMLLLSPWELIEGVVVPLMNEVGQSWADGQLTVAQEHAATAVVRAMLTEAVGRMEDEPSGGAHVLVATPAGQHHDVGALLVATTAAAMGCRITFLGADLPADDIADAARATSVDLVALSIVHLVDDPALPAELVRLGGRLPASVPVVVGGAGAQRYRSALDAAGLRHMDDLVELRDLLSELGRATQRHLE